MRTVFASSLCCALACTTPAPQPAAKAEPEQPSRPSTDTPERTAPEVARPDPPTEPSPEPPTAAVREAGVPAPDAKAILALAREVGLKAPASATKPEPFGPRSYVAMIRTRSGAGPAKFNLHALLLKLPETEGAAWTIASSIDLFGWSRDWYDDDEDAAGSIPTTIHVDDYEDDGELELLVRFRDEIMCPGGGPNEVTTLMFVEFAETPPRVALKTEIDHAISSGAAQTETTLSHEDLDGDKHRDLKIVYRSSSEDEPKVERAERRWRWDAATDGWVRMSADGTWTEYESGEGCDW